MTRFASKSVALSVALAVGAGGCTSTFTPTPNPTAQFDDISYANWTTAEPEYRLYPGDQIELIVPSATELNRALTVQPDGRVTFPLLPPVMVADRSIEEVSAAVTQAYSAQLVRPEVEINLKQAGPLKVFVGGEVNAPGVFDMPGDINTLQAVIMAGGFNDRARRQQVIVIRRGPDGRPMMRTVNLLQVLTNPAAADTVPLRRFDIVFVPRTPVSELGLFVQQNIRDLLPIQLGFNYAFGPNYSEQFFTGYE